ncbi:IclR family transcriptional regulator domain-containing protein [Paracoccus gahaiensis]|uniref:IclR family transcriptional regulator domain-containing protein n=1 Tax=Paracoccus gahaiensis TaxID=1706839 RepID=UPI001FE4A51B|nr:IclR family transcriptional regulator C-terminal domain-containing protein [Paracoccus gahaiensis]
MAIALMPGSRLPAHCTSMGRVLLAELPEEQSRALLKRHPPKARTPRTVTDLAELLARIAEARSRGHAVIDQEVELGSARSRCRCVRRGGRWSRR